MAHYGGNPMKNRNIITATVVTAMLLFSSNAFAGRYSAIYDGFKSIDEALNGKTLSETFNDAAKGGRIDPPPGTAKVTDPHPTGGPTNPNSTPSF